MAIEFDQPGRRIVITAPQTVAEAQDIINATRLYEAEFTTMQIPKIIDTFGKQPLGGGVFVGITLVILDPWVIAFDLQNIVDVSLTGGNIVAFEADGVTPRSPLEAPSVTVTQSSSGTLLDLPIENLRYAVESQRFSHSNFGQTFYWDPFGGDDTKDGLTSTRGVKTFPAAQDLVVDGRGDSIYLLGNDPSPAGTIVTERITITKNRLLLRGPGHKVIFDPSAGSGPIVTIDGDEAEVSSLRFRATTAPVDNAILVRGNEAAIRANVIGDGTIVNGVRVENGSFFTRVVTCLFRSCTGEAIRVDAGSDACFVIDNRLYNTGGVGIHVAGASDQTDIENNIIKESNGGAGPDIQVDSGSTQTVVRYDNTYSSLQPTVVDLGTDTTLEHNVQNIGEGIFGDREIDFTGADVAGWQRVQRDDSGFEIKRYNLFDEADARITGTVAAFITAQHMIAKETEAP